MLSSTDLPEGPVLLVAFLIGVEFVRDLNLVWVFM